jgi:hypothetical protein
MYCVDSDVRRDSFKVISENRESPYNRTVLEYSYMKTDDYEVEGRGVVVEGGWVLVCAESSYAPVNTLNVFCDPCYTMVAEMLPFLKEEKHNLIFTVRQ